MIWELGEETEVNCGEEVYLAMATHGTILGGKWHLQESSAIAIGADEVDYIGVADIFFHPTQVWMEPGSHTILMWGQQSVFAFTGDSMFCQDSPSDEGPSCQELRVKDGGLIVWDRPVENRDQDWGISVEKDGYFVVVNGEEGEADGQSGDDDDDGDTDGDGDDSDENECSGYLPLLAGQSSYIQIQKGCRLTVDTMFIEQQVILGEVGGGRLTVEEYLGPSSGSQGYFWVVDHHLETPEASPQILSQDFQIIVHQHSSLDLRGDTVISGLSLPLFRDAEVRVHKEFA